MLPRLVAVSVFFATIVVVALVGHASASSKNFLRHPSRIVQGLLCIHRFEGSWTDPYSPYWGGLQMDLSFQETYGWLHRGRHHKWYFLKKWGTADNWPVWAQIVAGIHGYESRGWSPWPNTAHYCGLL